MERYFPTISKPSLNLRTKGDEKQRYQPYSKSSSSRIKLPTKEVKGSKTISGLDLTDGCSDQSAITKLLLKTLSDASNPITHSDIYERTEHIISLSTGHQVSEGNRSRGEYFVDREHKLSVQCEGNGSSSANQVLHGVRAYINGYLSGTTDIEMKRIVVQAGGQMLPTASRATHILTSQGLNGSKTHKFLTSKPRDRRYVVKPEWVFDSIASGRQRPEREYSIIHDRSKTWGSFVKK